MTNNRRGTQIALSPGRKMVLELLHHARKVPSLPLSRVINVESLIEARRRSDAPVSWTAVFMRAYGLTALRHPELRRAFIPWPRPHIYEHPQSECALLIEREWRGEPMVLGAKVRSPETTTLAELDAQLRHLKEAPIMEVNYYRQVIRLSRLPGFIRRFTFWHSLYLSGFTRAKRLGTFMISSLGNLGVEQHHPLTPLTTYFTFGPISPAGDVTAKIVYDHRVLDGRTVARSLQTLNEILQTTLRAEMAGQRAAAA